MSSPSSSEQIHSAAYRWQRDVESGERVVVGVNRFADDQPVPPPPFRHDPEVERRQVENLARVKRERDGGRVQRLLAELQEVVRDRPANVMPITIEAVEARASMGEIVSAVRGVLGQYRERPVF